VEYRFSGKQEDYLRELKIQHGDPFSLSQSTSVVLQDPQMTDQNMLLSSRGDERGETFGGRPSQALANLIWQVPFNERKSILDSKLEFPFEDTDLGDDEQDYVRRMSIRNFNVVGMKWLNANPYKRCGNTPSNQKSNTRLSILGRASKI
jgi:hypothetical protein